MGNSSAKKTNRMLDEQLGLTRGFGTRMEDVANQERSRNRGLEDLVTSGIGSLWNQGTGSFSPYMTEAMPFYRKAMDTGLFDQGQMNDFRARAGINNAMAFQGLKRQLDEGANIRGGGFAGYSGQRALLARDKARQAEEARLGAETSLQDMIRKNMFSGAEGVSGADRDYQQGLLASAQLANQGLGQRANLLGLLSNLRGNDLGYSQLAGSEYGQGLNTINSRVQETPWWQTALGAASGIAGVALPFLGNRGMGQQIQNIPSTGRQFNQLIR